MTFGDRTEVKRAKVGTKVLAFGCAIFAVLGSFWTIVWFIRSYVEPPRVTISPALALASRDSTPVAPPAPAPRSEATAPTLPPAAPEARPCQSTAHSSSARRASAHGELAFRSLAARAGCSGTRAGTCCSTRNNSFYRGVGPDRAAG